MSQCAVCGNIIDSNSPDYNLTVNGETYFVCSSDCLFKSEPMIDFKHLSLSTLVLNKTLFEILAIITGFSGVYFTVYETGFMALLMDTVSVIFALAAMVIGIEHLRYVEEHQLVKKAVLIIGIAIILIFLIFVWQTGFIKHL